ncbi:MULTISPECIES: hypothetical protein [Moorena]|nr:MULTISPECIES: hypothetical protein [Moorena]NEP37363.1 hypothetical protein [Moorena sp. SIO3B2]OLT63842.1 hypothetical protein BI334_01295 [Moorena producens 3L]
MVRFRFFKAFTQKSMHYFMLATTVGWANYVGLAISSLCHVHLPTLQDLVPFRPNGDVILPFQAISIYLF